MWLPGPSTKTDVEPFGADPAPTPDVSPPPRLCQPWLTPGVVPANSLHQVRLSSPRTNTTPTPGAGVATPTSPVPRPPSECQPDQWAPSVLLSAHTVPVVPMASTYSVPPTFTAAGPLPASVRPPRLRQGFRTVGVISLSQTAPSPPRTTTSMAPPPLTDSTPAATPGRDVSPPPKDFHTGAPAGVKPLNRHSALSPLRAKGPATLGPNAATAAGTKASPGPPTRLPPGEYPSARDVRGAS